MEYLLVVAFAFLLLVPIILISMTQSGRFQNDVTASQIQKVGEELRDAIDTVYYSGPPTKRTLKLFFPHGIKTITYDEEAIIFTMMGFGGNYEYVLTTATNLTGELRTFKGVHTIIIEALDDEVNVTG